MEVTLFKTDEGGFREGRGESVKSQLSSPHYAQIFWVPTRDDKALYVKGEAGPGGEGDPSPAWGEVGMTID